MLGIIHRMYLGPLLHGMTTLPTLVKESIRWIIRLKGKLALVTGSTLGIVKAIAIKLLQEGTHVIINGRSQDQVDNVLEELHEIGEVYGVTADISTTTGADHLVNAANAIGDVDILVNNVGFFEFKPFFQVADHEWSKLFDLNVMSGVWLTRALMPKMLGRN